MGILAASVEQFQNSCVKQPLDYPALMMLLCYIFPCIACCPVTICSICVVRVLQQSFITNRMLARVAGNMVAASPAVPLGPLFARGVYEAMHGEEGWDNLYPSQAACRQDLQCFVEAVTISTGGNWWKRQATLLVAGDASEFAYEAYTPEGELQHPIVVSFTKEELQLMADKCLSSTLREIVCMLKATEVLLQHTTLA